MTADRLFLAAGLLVTAPGLANGQVECVGVDARCETAGGSYHVLLPDEMAADTPVILFLHGYAADGLSMLRSERVAPPLLARGYVVVAPNGRDRDGSDGGRWSFHPERPETRDEADFLQEVRADLAVRFGLDMQEVLLGGWSIGGSMASYIACEAPQSYAAFLPVAGSFWRPHPGGCDGPVRLFHTHGWTDGTVPLEGRPIGGGRIIQGDVFHSLEIWREANACDGLRPESFSVGESFWLRSWSDCADGSALGLALHPGGHRVPVGWADLAIDWYESLDRDAAAARDP